MRHRCSEGEGRNHVEMGEFLGSTEGNTEEREEKKKNNKKDVEKGWKRL